MKYWLIPCFFLLFSCAQPKNGGESESKTYHIVGYVAGWKELNPKKIPAEKLTHINYAFANVADGIVTNMEGRAVRDSMNFQKLQELKKRNPALKILVSIGGWTHSKGFSDAVLTEESRKKLTASGIDFLLKYKLDGLDFDWEYPALQGDNNVVRAEDKDNFVAMLKSFREALDSVGSLNNTHYLSTIASGGFRNYLEVNNLGEAQEYLDFINIMAYDFYTAGDAITGHHANLFPNGAKGRSAQTTVEEHLEFGVPAEKLVLGVPFYGRMWKGVDPTDNGLFKKGKFEMGLPYHQVFALSRNSTYSRFWDSKASAPYLFSLLDSAWVTFEDPESLALKMEFVKKKGLAGAMFWEMSEDNTGTLLDALHEVLSPKSVNEN
ncbi:glycoside hydrolase family 18 protein [Algoriphagus sp.]|uniref:glycoside hydrolase family 18 protein n=1 Tax=Algoriphagus sp. TaxID=1872435 RepID=UPI002727ACC9|nr:glycoside hydrolase family 18 protein [Algoriphagus sp.]MDO8967174.1 glycoside hydrolase family 18 protein [Algoriphagus sp.]MDP3198318.1 glycoside hydrolase family 18 protein [Algoriphagus sp.]